MAPPGLDRLVETHAMIEQIGGDLKIADLMRFDPPVPSAVTAPSGSRMMVGAIIEESRVPVRQASRPPCIKSFSPNMLFSMKPKSPTMKPSPSPFDRLIAGDVFPSASITLTWVVPR